MAHNSLGSLVGRKFVIRSVEYHTVWYRLWPTIAWSARRSQVCNTFRCIPCSLVPLVAHNSLRFIPYRLVACGSQIVIRALCTIQSGTTWGSHFATVYTIRHGIAGGSPFALRWLRLFLGGVMVHHITLGGLLKIPLAWILTRVQVTVRPVVVPGHPSVTRANTSPSKRVSMVNEGVK